MTLYCAALINWTRKIGAACGEMHVPPEMHAILPCSERKKAMRINLCGVIALLLLIPCAPVYAQCPEEPPLQNYTGAGTVACPCFVPGEEAGAILNVPAEMYPIEILRVGIGWASQYGGAFQQIEQAIHIYAGGLPNPGTPVFSLEGPQLTDGVINVFDLEPLPGEIAIESGPFTVTLEFLNQNSGDPFAPTVVHDGNGCQTGKNVVYAIPGGWYDAVLLGVTGDWVFFVVYRPLRPASLAAAPESIVFSGVPANETSCDTVFITNEGCDMLLIHGISGCTVSPFSLDTTMTDHAIAPSNSTMFLTCVTPGGPGADSCTVTITSNDPSGPSLIPVLLDIVSAVGPTPVPGPPGSVFVAPNPFTLSTTVHFRLTDASRATVEIWSVDGKRIRTLALNQAFSPGDNTVLWNGLDAKGTPVASGIYFVRVVTPLGDKTARMVLLR